MKDNVAVLFPGALGDFICVLPILRALRHRTRGTLAVIAKDDVLDLLPTDGFVRISITRREISDLFAISPLNPTTRDLLSGFDYAHSWTGHGDPNFSQRLREATGGSVFVHPFRAMRMGEHATAYYSRCVGLPPEKAPLETTREAPQWAARFIESHRLRGRLLVAHPGSGSLQKNWEGMSAVVAWWREELEGKVLVLTGPAEEDRQPEGHDCSGHEPPSSFPLSKGGGRGVLRVADPVLRADAALHCETLSRVAAVLERATLFLGNDSGISHLAGAVGARGLVLFGPTDPYAWRPLGGHMHVLAAPTPCPICSLTRFCIHRLPVNCVCEALLEAERCECESSRIATYP